MPNLKSRNPYVLTVTLNTTIDTMLRYRAEKASHRFQEETSVAGGKGLNVSRALESLGCPNYATGVVGGRTGKRIIGLLRAEGLRHRFFANKFESRHNLILCVPVLGTSNRVFGQTPEISKGAYTAFQDLYGSLMTRASMVVVSGSVLRGVPDQVYANLVRKARVAKVPVLLDASGAALREGIKARPMFIKPNKVEAQQATGIRIRTVNDAVRAAKRLRRKRVDNIFISLGEKGAIGCNHNELWYAKAPKVKVTNTVGCGDAFVAAVCAAHLRHYDFSDTLRFAVAAGTVNASNIVPGKIAPTLVRNLYKDITLRKVAE